LDSDFEPKLYKSLPLNQKELDDLEVKYNGMYAHWVGELMHIANKS